MKDLWMILAFVGVWLALQLWILPRLGVPTRMSRSCGISGGEASTQNTAPSDSADAEASGTDSAPNAD